MSGFEDLGRYDALPIDGSALGQLGGSAGSASQGTDFQSGQSLAGLYENAPSNPYQAQVDQFRQNPMVSGFYAMLDLNGDGRVSGPETASAVSSLSDLVKWMLAGVQPGPNAPAAVEQLFSAHDLDRDRLYCIDEIRTALRDLRPVIDSIKLDQFRNPANVGRPFQVGSAQLDPAQANRIAKCPVLGQQIQAGGGAQV
ncbi:hypothetical protein DYH09_18035 [bacterium CPR1]|nr:hypothetical protein [bacterium CPR1]